MFNRLIIKELENWLLNPSRKPLVLRGARQVGKTTLVKQFSQKFEQYIYLNLELPQDKKPFQEFKDIETLIQSLFFIKDMKLDKKQQTLLFIDEIQEFPEAINMLRYFYEFAPEMPVIAAGSMLETLFNKNLSFPVGRVEYKVVRPVSFPEFLEAMGETSALEQLKHIPINDFAHDKLLKLYHTYALIGGMPEIVSHYSQHKDFAALSPLYDSLIASYLDDVEKYAVSNSQMQHIRHAIRASFLQAGRRIKFKNFGNTAYRSRDISEALRSLEKVMLLKLVYPCTQAELPIMPDVKRAPRLQVLDTGMLNYFAGIQKEILGSSDLNSTYQGIVIEHLTGQEILAMQYDALSSLHFWVREKKTSSAEVDFLYAIDSKLIPIEVKSGTEGKLKSLHLFMNISPQRLAIRFYAGKLQLSKVITSEGKEFQILSIPYYLVSELKNYIRYYDK